MINAINLLELCKNRRRYVLVPKFTDHYGCLAVDRLDMNNVEWQTWLQARDIAEMRKAAKACKDLAKLPRKLLAVLTEAGVPCALAGSAEAGELRRAYLNSRPAYESLWKKPVTVLH